MLIRAQVLLLCFFGMQLFAADVDNSEQTEKKQEAAPEKKDAEQKSEQKAAEKTQDVPVTGKWELGVNVARVWGKSSFEDTRTSGAAGLSVSRFFSPLDAGRRYSLKASYLPIAMSMTHEDRQYRGVLNGYLVQFGLQQRIRGKHWFTSALGLGLFSGRFRSIDTVEPVARKTVFYPALPLNIGYAWQVSEAISFGPELIGGIGRFRYFGAGIHVEMKF